MAATNCGCFVIVPQSEVALVERCGKYTREARPGCSFINCCLCENVAGVISLKLRQLVVSCETKTLDDVSVVIATAIQFQTPVDKVFEAFYELSEPLEQIKSYVLNVVRAEVPKLKLNETFSNKDDIASAVRDQLQSEMEPFGYNIITALIVDIDQDAKVKAAMNEINAATRMRMAANEKAEAEKIIVIKAAEAEAEAKALAGEGVARQRKAIIEGLQSTVTTFTEGTGTSASEVMGIVLTTQYFDSLEKIAGNGKGTVFVNSSPTAASDIADQFRNAQMQANSLKDL